MEETAVEEKKKRQLKLNYAELYPKVIARIGEGATGDAAAKEFGISSGTACRWRRQAEKGGFKTGKPMRFKWAAFHEQAETLKKSGMTDSEIAEKIGVKQSTISEWVKRAGLGRRAVRRGRPGRPKMSLRQKVAAQVAREMVKATEKGVHERVWIFKFLPDGIAFYYGEEGKNKKIFRIKAPPSPERDALMFKVMHDHEVSEGGKI